MRAQKRLYRRRKIYRKNIETKKSEGYFKKFLFYFFTAIIGFAMWGAQQNTIRRSELLLKQSQVFLNAAIYSPKIYYLNAEINGELYNIPHVVIFDPSKINLLLQINEPQNKIDYLHTIDAEELNFASDKHPINTRLFNALDKACKQFRLDDWNSYSVKLADKVDMNMVLYESSLTEDEKKCLHEIEIVARLFDHQKYRSFFSRYIIEPVGYRSLLYLKSDYSYKESRVTIKNFVIEFIRYFQVW